MSARMEYDEDQLDQAVSFLTPICNDAAVPYSTRNEVCVALGRIKNARQFRFEWDEEQRRRWYAVSWRTLRTRDEAIGHVEHASEMPRSSRIRQFVQRIGKAA